MSSSTNVSLGYPAVLGVSAALTVVYQLTFFIVAFACTFDKLTDFAGGTNFLVLALLSFFVGDNRAESRPLLLTVLVAIWSLRLALFLLIRILMWGEDRRFDETRTNFWKFLAFWVAQMIWVFTVTLPVQLTNGGAGNTVPVGANALDIVGIAMFAAGLVLEAWADQTKLNFKKSPEARGKWCTAGPWAWSRHPNYAGEIALWFGVFLVSLRGFVQENVRWNVYVIAALSPIFVAVLLLFGSGMPLLEASANRKFGVDTNYLDYRRRTSPIIPLPPAVYANLPTFLKSTLLCEWNMYAPKDEEQSLSAQPAA